MVLDLLVVHHDHGGVDLCLVEVDLFRVVVVLCHVEVVLSL